MKTAFKPLHDQVIVIADASNSIGLATARMAADRGAKTVLCSPHFEELKKFAHEIELSGGRAFAVECDVSNPDSVENAASAALDRFGRIDTWVNNASHVLYGKLWDIPLREKRRLFDVNFWGVVHGCRSAVKAMRESGGVIINVGSIFSDRAVPTHGMYSASQHAVKGYTNALRAEIDAEEFPIAVTMVKPAPVEAPFFEPMHHTPAFAPELVADAILDSAEHPKRDVIVGTSAMFYSFIKNRPFECRRESSVSESLRPLAASIVATGLGLAAAAGIGFALKRSQSTEPDQTGLRH